MRWLAERLGLIPGLGSARTASLDSREVGAEEGPAARPEDRPRAPRPEDPPAVTVPELDDDIPGALRERHPPSPAMVAAVVAQPEAEGPKGVFPWTVNQYEEYPNLNPGPVGRRAADAFSGRR
ncbi:hypothetical protein [Azospirillum melinis]|uniref:hypothetical protein n=1 Tax=Azospirillum melinis TaxID=328839 RepID=UPI001FECFA14|nr:hypothetical protein [Azospirillum melinis]MBP2309580.1 hypothetical protein [Azospirillum melinis]